MPMLPLAHIKVLEITVARAGPTAGRHLADWGADVVRIEPPLSVTEGEDMTGDRFGPDRINLHRNKRSITLNLKEPEGHAIFLDLARTADVVIENMRPDVKHRLRIDDETLRAVNPRIVYGSISGFGQTGPYSRRAGVDQVVQGLGGLMSITGLPGQGPVRVGVPMVDLTAGGFLAQAILIALLERERTGVGRWVHTSLIESMIFMLDLQAARWLMAGEVAGQAGNNHPTAIPTGLYPTADGEILIGAGGDRMWDRFCKVIGAPHLLEDARYASANGRLSHRDALNDDIAAITRTRTSQYWFDLMSEGGVPCGPVNTIDKVFADPQVSELGMTLKGHSPMAGDFTVVAQPNNIEGVNKHIRLPPPALGEHTDEILKTLSLSDETIARLRARNVI